MRVFYVLELAIANSFLFDMISIVCYDYDTV